MSRTPVIIAIAGLSLLTFTTIVSAEDKTPPAELTKDMVLIPAGEFTLGLSKDEVPAISDALGAMPKYFDCCTPSRKINLPAFYIDKYEVTNEQYKKFLDATNHTPPEPWGGNNFPAGKAKHPVVNITWEDASAYAKWAGKRLPTEAEWEKAARGTDGRYFPWGNKFEKSAANTDESGKGTTTAAGSYEAGKSPYGVYDMAGNVWEWTADYYLPYPGNTYADEFYGKERYVLRGGSFADLNYDALTFIRSKFTPQTDDDNVGFRCAY
ncbi:MAG: formylglycine-generating enzyme family protein [Candidatus Schekmanbacteria bacterium]|nr:formylglycine-generating enzyme family protein [Candidatus Schekmanbacteria bacterium]